MLVQAGIRSLDLRDVEPLLCGTEDCSPGHSWGPGVRDHHLIHYVLEGRGTLHSRDRIHTVRSGQLFLVTPNELVTWRADEAQPWRYIWVGFRGDRAGGFLEAGGLDADSPVFTDAAGELRDCFVRMTETFAMAAGRELRLTGLLYLMLSVLAERAASDAPERPCEGRAAAYARAAMRFFEGNLANGTGVAECARHLGLERSYFSALFRRHVGFSPMDWLINLRMDHAMRLLRNPSLNVAHVARSVGYEDPLQFSRIFRGRTGMSPAAFRRGLEESANSSEGS